MTINNLNVGVNLDKEKLAIDLANFYMAEKYSFIENKTDINSFLFKDGKFDSNNYQDTLQPEFTRMKNLYLSMINSNIKSSVKEQVNISNFTGTLNL